MRTDDRTVSESPGPTAAGRVTRRRFLTLGAGATVGVAGGLAFGRIRAPGPASAMEKLLGLEHRTTSDRRRLAAHPDAVFGIDTDERVIGLSFDDGPDGRYTADVLDVLADRDVTATFFLVGANALAHPDLVARIVADGHSIGNHTRTHAALDELDERGSFEEILGGAADITEAGGGATPMFRPPYGLTNASIGSFTSAMGMETIFWSDSLEKRVLGHGVDEGVRSALAELGPGDLVLAHDGSGAVHRPEHRRTDRSSTVRALPHLLDGLMDRGYRIVDVPGLLSAGPRRGPEALRR